MIVGGMLYVKFVNGYVFKVGDIIVVVDGVGSNC